MGLISKEEAFRRFAQDGRNSSHFVWFLSEVEFFETSQGWIFGFRRLGAVYLFAFEPLVPRKSEGYSYSDFSSAWEEVRAELSPPISLFVSVYQPFMETLKAAAAPFQILAVGKEPYVDLRSCVPTGKSGKGVRAARNQALRAGVTVQEWKSDQILSHATAGLEMRSVLAQWKARNAVDLGGFVNKVDPFAHMDIRRYFLAFSAKNGLEAFLVATPIPGENNFFLEDMVVKPGATRGTGELLTLEAMIALSEGESAQKASLGVVSLTSIDESSAHNISGASRWALVTLPKFLTKIYNVDGLEVFRRRFKPSAWENVYLCLENRSGRSDLYAWGAALFALVRSFEPRLTVGSRWLLNTVLRPLRKHPVSCGMTLITSLSFWLINRGGELPAWALQRHGFYGSAPLWEWPLRSITSDLMFFDLTHYAACTAALFFLLRWMERTYSANFVFWFAAAVSFFDDFVNQILLVYPYSYFQPKMFENLVLVNDVGTSLLVSAVLGIQLCSFKKNREIFYTFLSVGMVLCFAFSSTHRANLILNLNHFVFLAFGFVAGKLKFEHDRNVSRAVARQKPPQTAKLSIAQQEKRAA